MTATKKTTLKRPIHAMSAFVRSALTEQRLLEAYQARPPYQKNDYLGWIKTAKLEATKEKRVDQMLSELRAGNKYMKMNWTAGDTKE